ncbi:MAG: hypothetical protein KGN34_04130 [Sphingomonadales bacterium]|nr:hypothetical protein [Sphingomonadales bacterium]
MGDKPEFASWITLGDAVVAEVMARAGFDWLILDGQHGAVNPGNLLGLLQAVDLGGTRALVRVSANDPAEIMRALDLGAAGVVVPLVSTAEEAARAARACRYPPHGMRSFGRVRSYYAGGDAAPAPVCWVMIETAEALANLDAIAATPGVHGLFVGPADLGLSMGYPPGAQVAEPVMAAIAQVVAACERHGATPGSASFGPENAQALLDLGMRFVTLGADAGFVRRGAAAEVARARAWQAGQGGQA